MCGRFTQHYTWEQIHEFLSVFGPPQNLQARYNIAPTTLVDIVRHDTEGRCELVRGVRWGLIPNWWKRPLKDLPATFNARVETVGDKPMFRGAYRSRRCVVPASGFYEWTGPKGEKQPHMFVAAVEAISENPVLLAARFDQQVQALAVEEPVGLVFDGSVYDRELSKGRGYDHRSTAGTPDFVPAIGGEVTFFNESLCEPSLLFIKGLCSATKGYA